MSDPDAPAAVPADATDGTATILDQLAAGVVAQAAHENFPVALRILPRSPRAHLSRIYGYARFVDDLGDNAPGDRLRLLDAVERDVHALYAGGTPRLPLVAALRPLVDEHHVPIDPFLDLIEANRIDQRVSSYETFDDLVDYCRYSANPVGRLVLYTADAVTGTAIARSDDVCTGLQILEHCQDVREDAERGRVYLPATELRSVGVDDQQLRARTASPALRMVIGEQVQRAADLLAPGRPLVRSLRGWPRIAIAGFVGGGLATVDVLRRAGNDSLGQDVHPSRVRTSVHAVRLMVGR